MLIQASKFGLTKMVKLLLSQGHKHDDALYWTARSGHAEIVKLLREYK
jgi:hypothetical protein